MSVLPPSFPQPQLPPREPNTKFEAFKRMLEQGNKHEFDEVSRLIDQSFPGVDERLEYLMWSTEPQRKYAEEYHEPAISPEEYMEKLRTTHYNNEDELDYLYDINFLRYTPVIVIGRSRGIVYKVTLSNRLEPRGRAIPNESRPILLYNVLGFNDNVEPNPRSTLRQRRNQTFPEESTCSTESDDYTPNAFHVFHQIGSLMYYNGDFDEDPERAMEDYTNWTDTGFAVVSNVTSGRAEGVWLVFNFYPFDADCGECYHVDSDLDWGWLPNHEGDDDEMDEQFSSAKIADSLADLGPNYEFKLEHKLMHEPEIVRVVKTAEGLLLRQSINRENVGRRAVS